VLIGVAIKYTSAVYEDPNKNQESKIETQGNKCPKDALLFKHPAWNDCMIIDGEKIYRSGNRDSASFIKEGNQYLIQWDKWPNLETFSCDKNNECTYIKPE